MAKFYTDLFILYVHLFITVCCCVQYYYLCGNRAVEKWFNFTGISLSTPALWYQNNCNTHKSPVCFVMKSY